jgi:hypothetical protein
MLLQKTMFPVRTAPAQRVEDAEGAEDRYLGLKPQAESLSPFGTKSGRVLTISD